MGGGASGGGGHASGSCSRERSGRLCARRMTAASLARSDRARAGDAPPGVSGGARRRPPAAMRYRPGR
ncbi:hypothetical protein ISF6_2438 [Piscinibacter sakaiensis]|uniref:Uncharacterized protein n=1 Tax=Piscinibacter sakaiensis TaxID=1547922 RepID=A0A0K8P1V3_PISS1|nr:hypothetical protein ISF6_2438 [Piscinibacter sakaiensis]